MLECNNEKQEKAFMYFFNFVIMLFLLIIIINIQRAFPSIIGNAYLESFSVIFLSILLEALPFIMLGSFISSLIQIFISEDFITKLLPKNKLIGLIMASLMGIVFPVCECAIIPITKKLLQKGVPLYMCITFMLAVPIANPIVLLSTYYAFSNQVSIVVLRGILGIAGAIIIGSITGYIQKKKPLKVDYHQPDCNCSCTHHHSYTSQKKPFVLHILLVIEHTSLELYDIGKLLIAGAFLSALLQTFVPKSFLISIGQGPILSILTMMLLAFTLSLCSEADAFIARTFVSQFTTGSILVFLILGPMIDIKNTLMLIGSFRLRFTLKLIAVIFSVCFLLAVMVNFLKL